MAVQSMNDNVRLNCNSKKENIYVYIWMTVVIESATRAALYHFLVHGTFLQESRLQQELDRLPSQTQQSSLTFSS